LRRCRRSGEPFGMGGVGGVEDLLAVIADRGGGAIVDVGRVVQTHAGVVVDLVVPSRELREPAAGVGEVVEPVGVRCI
jgi:hypothetical protein